MYSRFVYYIFIHLVGSNKSDFVDKIILFYLERQTCLCDKKNVLFKSSDDNSNVFFYWLQLTKLPEPTGFQIVVLKNSTVIL